MLSYLLLKKRQTNSTNYYNVQTTHRAAHRHTTQHSSSCSEDLLTPYKKNESVAPRGEDAPIRTPHVLTVSDSTQVRWRRWSPCPRPTS